MLGNVYNNLAMKLQLIKKGWNTSRERGTVETYLDQSIKDSRGIEGLFDSGYQRMQGVKYKHLSDRKREGEKYIYAIKSD